MRRFAIDRDDVVVAEVFAIFRLASEVGVAKARHFRNHLIRELLLELVLPDQDLDFDTWSVRSPQSFDDYATSWAVLVWKRLELDANDLALASLSRVPAFDEHLEVVSGVERGDVVTHVDGRRVNSARAFFEMLETAVDGQVLKLTLLRDGATRQLDVRAQEVPERVIETMISELLGMDLAPGDKGGYVVRSVRRGSGAERIGIQPGDVILGINGRTLEDADALRRSALDLRGRARAQIVVQRGGGRYHVTIPLV